jgi:hypothetical protein
MKKYLLSAIGLINLCLLIVNAAANLICYNESASFPVIIRLVFFRRSGGPEIASGANMTLAVGRMERALARQFADRTCN